MNGFPFHLRVALIVAALFVPAASANQPTYQQLDAAAPSLRKLRAAPTMLSRAPTTFSLALSADGTQLRTVDIDGRVWQRQVRGAGDLVLVAKTDSELACAAISSDAKLLAFADPDGSVALLDLDTEQIIFRNTAFKQRTVTLSFSSDSLMLAGVTVDGEVRLWEAASGKLLHELTAERGPVQTIAFSPDGDQLAIASFSHAIKLYRLQQEGALGDAEPQVIDIGSRVTTFSFTPDGKQLVIASADGSTAVHELSSDREPIELGTHPFATWCIAFEPSGQRMAAGSWDGTIKLWDTTSWQPLQAVKTHEESVSAMIFDTEQGLISAGLDGRLLGWLPEVPSLSCSGMIAGRTDSVWVAVYSPDGTKLFIGGREKRFELWDVVRHELLVAREGHPTTRCAAFSPDGKTLATGGDDGTIFICDAATGATRGTLLRHPGAVSAVVFADDGQTLVSGCDGGFVKVWDTASGQEKHAWREHKQQVYCADISPDGAWLVTGGGNWTTGDPGELIVWDLKAGRVRAKLDGHKLAVWTIVFTPDGKRFAASDSSGAVKVWNLQNLEEERTLQHSTWVRPLAISPDGNTLAVGQGDGSVRLWDTATWAQTASYDGHDGFTFWLEYSPDGKTLATSGEDGTVRFWRTER